MSALSRISVDNHRLISVVQNDTVILSARIIPGNEKAIFRMIDHLFRRRVLVYYEGGRSAPIHVSGHASQEEMKILLQLVKPKYFVPVARRIPPTISACRAGGTGGRGFRPDFFARKRPSGGIHRRWASAPTRAGPRRARDGGFGIARGNRGCGGARPQASLRRWRGGRRSSPSTNIRACSKARPEIVTRGFLPSDDGQEVLTEIARSDPENGGTIQSRRKNGLERDQGKNSRGLETLPQQANRQAPAHPTCNSRSMMKYGDS